MNPKIANWEMVDGIRTILVLEIVETSESSNRYVFNVWMWAVKLATLCETSANAYFPIKYFNKCSANSASEISPKNNKTLRHSLHSTSTPDVPDTFTIFYRFLIVIHYRV